MTDSLDTIRAAYDGAAARYTAHVKAASRNPLDHALLDAFAELVGDTGPIADLGCGPGRLTGYFAASGHDVLGVDLAPEMIQLARTAYPELRFSVGSMTALDIPDGELAGVLAWYSVIHTPPAVLPAILGEFRRVLAPGGYALVGFFSGTDLDDEPREFDHQVTPGFRWPTGRMASLLAEAGFVEVATMVREPADTERFQRGHVLARTPAE